MNFAEFVRLDESEYVLVAAHRPRLDLLAPTAADDRRSARLIALTDQARSIQQARRDNRGLRRLARCPSADDAVVLREFRPSAGHYNAGPQNIIHADPQIDKVPRMASEAQESPASNVVYVTILMACNCD